MQGARRSRKAPKGGAGFGFASLTSASPEDKRQGVITGVSHATETAIETTSSIQPAPSHSVSSSVDEFSAPSVSRTSLSARRSTRSSASSQAGSPARAPRASSNAGANDDWENLLNDTSSPRKSRTKRKGTLREPSSLEATPPLAPMTGGMPSSTIRSSSSKRERRAQISVSDSSIEKRSVSAPPISLATDADVIVTEDPQVSPALPFLSDTSSHRVMKSPMQNSDSTGLSISREPVSIDKAIDLPTTSISSRNHEPVLGFLPTIAPTASQPLAKMSPLQKYVTKGFDLLDTTLAEAQQFSKYGSSKASDADPSKSEITDSVELPAFMSGWSGAAGWGDELDLENDDEDDTADAWDVDNIRSPSPSPAVDSEHPLESVLPYLAIDEKQEPERKAETRALVLTKDEAHYSNLRTAKLVADHTELSANREATDRFEVIVSEAAEVPHYNSFDIKPVVSDESINADCKSSTVLLEEEPFISQPVHPEPKPNAIFAVHETRELVDPAHGPISMSEEGVKANSELESANLNIAVDELPAEYQDVTALEEPSTASALYLHKGRIMDSVTSIGAATIIYQTEDEHTFVPPVSSAEREGFSIAHDKLSNNASAQLDTETAKMKKDEQNAEITSITVLEGTMLSSNTQHILGPRESIEQTTELLSQSKVPKEGNLCTGDKIESTITTIAPVNDSTLDTDILFGSNSKNEPKFVEADESGWGWSESELPKEDQPDDAWAIDNNDEVNSREFIVADTKDSERAVSPQTGQQQIMHIQSQTDESPVIEHSAKSIGISETRTRGEPGNSESLEHSKLPGFSNAWMEEIAPETSHAWPFSIEQNIEKDSPIPSLNVAEYYGDKPVGIALQGQLEESGNEQLAMEDSTLNVAGVNIFSLSSVLQDNHSFDCTLEADRALSNEAGIKPNEEIHTNMNADLDVRSSPILASIHGNLKPLPSKIQAKDPSCVSISAEVGAFSAHQVCSDASEKIDGSVTDNQDDSANVTAMDEKPIYHETRNQLSNLSVSVDQTSSKNVLGDNMVTKAAENNVSDNSIEHNVCVSEREGCVNLQKPTIGPKEEIKTLETRENSPPNKNPVVDRLTDQIADVTFGWTEESAQLQQEATFSAPWDFKESSTEGHMPTTTDNTETAVNLESAQAIIDYAPKPQQNISHENISEAEQVGNFIDSYAPNDLDRGRNDEEDLDFMPSASHLKEKLLSPNRDMAKPQHNAETGSAENQFALRSGSDKHHLASTFSANRNASEESSSTANDAPTYAVSPSASHPEPSFKSHMGTNPPDFSSWTWGNHVDRQASDSAWAEFNIATNNEENLSTMDTSAVVKPAFPAETPEKNESYTLSTDTQAQLLSLYPTSPRNSSKIYSSGEAEQTFDPDITAAHKTTHQESEVHLTSSSKSESERRTSTNASEAAWAHTLEDTNQDYSRAQWDGEMLKAKQQDSTTDQVPVTEAPIGFLSSNDLMNTTSSQTFSAVANKPVIQNILQVEGHNHKRSPEPVTTAGWDAIHSPSSNIPAQTAGDTVQRMENDQSRNAVSGAELYNSSGLTWAWQDSQNNASNYNSEAVSTGFVHNQDNSVAIPKDVNSTVEFHSTVENALGTFESSSNLNRKDSSSNSRAYVSSQATASGSAAISLSFAPVKHGDATQESNFGGLDQTSDQSAAWLEDLANSSVVDQMNSRNRQSEIGSSGEVWGAPVRQPVEPDISLSNTSKPTSGLSSSYVHSLTQTNYKHERALNAQSPLHSSQGRLSPQVPVNTYAPNAQFSTSQGEASPYPPSPAISSPTRSEPEISMHTLKTGENESFGLSYAPRTQSLVATDTLQESRDYSNSPLIPPNTQTEPSSRFTSGSPHALQKDKKTEMFGSTPDIAADLWSAEYGGESQGTEVQASASYSSYASYNNNATVTASSTNVSEEVWSSYTSKDLQNPYAPSGKLSQPIPELGAPNHMLSSNDIPPQPYEFSFSIMDANAPDDTRSPRSLISWGFGGSLLCVTPNQSAPESEPFSNQNMLTNVCMYDMSSVAQDSSNEDWIASFEIVRTLSAVSEADLLPIADMCQKLANCSTGRSRDVAESVSLLWHLLSVLCRNPRGNWYSQFAPFLGGRTSVPLFDRGRASAPNEVLQDSPLSLSTTRTLSIEGEQLRVRAAARIERLISYGKREEGLDEARKSGLWSLALMISASLNRNAHMKTMSDFARENLKNGSALQTLCLSTSENDDELVRLSTSTEGLSNWKKTVSVLLERMSASSVSGREMHVVQKIGDALMSQGQDFAAAHICFLICGRIKSLSFNEGHVALLGAHSNIPAGRPSSFGSMIPILQSLVFEAVHYVQHGRLFPHLLPFRLIVAHNLVSVGKLDIALQQCDLMVASVKSIFEKTNASEASKHLTPPFLSSLESLDGQLRQRLGISLNDGAGSRFKGLKQSLSSVFKKSTEVILSSTASFSVPSAQKTDHQVSPPAFRSSTQVYSETGNIPAQPIHYVAAPSDSFNYQSPREGGNFTANSTHNSEEPQTESASKRWDSLVASTIKVLAPAEGDLSPPPVRPTSDAFSNEGYHTGLQSQPNYAHMRSASVGDVPSVMSDQSTQEPSNSWNQATTGYGTVRETRNPPSNSFTQMQSTQFPSGHSETDLLLQSNTYNDPMTVPRHRRSASDMTHDMQTSEKRPPRPPKKRGGKVGESTKDADDNATSESSAANRSSSRWAWRPRIAARLREAFGAPKQAHMGEKNAFVFDKEKGRWVIPGEDSTKLEEAILPPPDDDMLSNTGFSNVPESQHLTPEISMGEIPGQHGIPDSGNGSWQSSGPSINTNYGGSVPSHGFSAQMPMSGAHGNISGNDSASATASQNGYGDNLSESSVASAASAPAPMSTRHADLAPGAPINSGNKYRAGRSKLSGRRAYVDTFNPGIQSMSVAPVMPLRPPVRAAPLPPIRSSSSGSGVKIFTPGPAPVVNYSASFDDNLSSASMNEMSNTATMPYPAMRESSSQPNIYTDTSHTIQGSPTTHAVQALQAEQAVHSSSLLGPTFQYTQNRQSRNSPPSGPRMSA